MSNPWKKNKYCGGQNTEDFALGLHTFLFMYLIVKKVNCQNFSMVLNKDCKVLIVLPPQF